MASLTPVSGRRPRRIVFAAAASAVLALLAACSSSSKGGGSNGGSGDFVIGAAVPLSGKYAAAGQWGVQGLKVGAQLVNADGGINGQQVKVVSLNATDATSTLAAVQQLVTKDHAKVIYTDISSTVPAFLPYTTANKVISMALSGTASQGDPTKYKYSFVIADPAQARETGWAQAIIKVAKDQGVTKVGILHDSNLTQTLMVAALPNTLKAAGLSVVADKQIDDTAVDFTPQLQALKSAGAQLVAYASGSAATIHVVTLGLQTLGWKAPIVSEPSPIFGDLKSQIPPAVQPQFHASMQASGLRIGNTVSPEMTKYLSVLKGIGPYLNVPYTVESSCAVFYAKLGWEAAKKQSGNTDSDSVVKALEGIGSMTIPAQYQLAYKNPEFSATDHSVSHADYSQFWGIIGAVNQVEGLYPGELTSGS